VSPSFVETIKAAEPLFSVLLGFFFFQEGTQLSTYLTLIPICGGVAIACVGNASYSLMGLIASAASNVGFASRSVFSKRLNKLHPGCLDEISLFGYISQIGLLVLVPLTFFSEGSGVASVFAERSAMSQSGLLSYVGLLAINGAAYSVYNLASFAVLAKSDLITHAVFNAFRRVVSISFTVAYFGVVISSTNALGVLIAVGGVLAFGYAKSQEGKVKSN
jgi:solute carrier family 35 protein E1